MKKIGMKIISTLLIVCVVLGNVQMVRADILDTKPVEIYRNEEENYTLTRIIEGPKVTVIMKTLDGTIEHIAVNDNGNLYLDNRLIQEDIYNTSNLGENFNDKILNLSNARSTSWGKWQYTELDPIDVSGRSTKMTLFLLTTAAPWLSARILSGIALRIADKYDEVQIEMRIRYREDDEYLYYQRDTWIYGDGELIEGPLRDAGQEALR